MCLRGLGERIRVFRANFQTSFKNGREKFVGTPQEFLAGEHVMREGRAGEVERTFLREDSGIERRAHFRWTGRRGRESRVVAKRQGF